MTIIHRLHLKLIDHLIYHLSIKCRYPVTIEIIYSHLLVGIITAQFHIVFNSDMHSTTCYHESRMENINRRIRANLLHNG